MDRSPVVAMASGSGTVLQALLDAASDPAWPAQIVAVVTDRPEVAALERAANFGVTTSVVSPADHGSREAWDRALTKVVADHDPQWVVSAGFMRILGTNFLERFGGRTINTHPALLPSFPGAHGVRDALAYGVKVSGCTVHLVDAGVDTGPILAQEAVSVADDDDEASLHERIKVMERRLLVDVVAGLARQGYTITDRKVTVP